MQIRVLLVGLVFGFALSRGRATDYDAIVDMFLLRDLHLALLMASAIAVAALGSFLIRRTRARAFDGAAIQLEPKPLHRGVWVGGLLFGFGWGLTGTCPGTGIAQIGEGKLIALFTVAGMLVGTWLYGRVHAFLAPRLLETKG
jgi:uncharacterized membrane protein YedE/YeeE